MTRRSRAREVALQLLFERDHNTHVQRPAIESFVRGRLREPELRTFCLTLFEGVVEHQPEIDKGLAAAADNWRLVRMATVDRNALRIGAFELLHSPETPPAVALNETIELARRYGTADSPAFVNGVLDRLLVNHQESGIRGQESGVSGQESEVGTQASGEIAPGPKPLTSDP